MGRLSDYVVKMLGFDLVAEFPPKVFSVGTSDTEIVKANADRIQLTLINLGSTVIYVHPTTKVSSSLGLYLDKNGGSVLFSALEDGELVGYEWYGISSSACNLWVLAVEGK